MSHSHGREETRNMRWQQRQREQNREMNRNRLESHPQGEHSGQSYDHDAENRWENDPAQNYAYPRQLNPEQAYNEFDSRYDIRSRSQIPSEPRYQDPVYMNREWVSGTGQPPYRGTRPSFAGRGPQGYRRPDSRIMEDINEAMTRDHDLDASGISVEAKDGEVVLTGTVSDRESKRRAEEIAESCSGVRNVQNQIRVRRENNPSTTLAS